MLTSSTPFVLSVYFVLSITDSSYGLSAPARLAVNQAVIRDDLGYAVSVSDKRDRLIWLAPNMPQVLSALRFGQRIIGMTSSCDALAGSTQRWTWGALRSGLRQSIGVRPGALSLRISVSFRCTSNRSTRPGFLRFC